MVENILSKISLIVIWLLLFATLLYADHAHDISKANDAYNSGDYETAFHVWGELAETGDLQAQEMFAAMYASGKGTGVDYEKAAQWYSKAAEKGSASAQFALANMYVDGRGVPKSLERAYTLMLISSAAGNGQAKKKAGEILAVMSPLQIEMAKEISFELLQKIAR